ncbi:class I SAM-dependent methyltransferase family protein [Streptomyces sp. NPDC059003]|uniref:class I SAM-dependent methyltransferase family protein n=1 Tax=Streptomyces sp. NPDC059003 TaxID=3346691 RepID=UPI003698FF97
MQTEEREYDLIWTRLAPTLLGFKEAALACDLWFREKDGRPDPTRKLQERVSDLARVLNEQIGVDAPGCAEAKEQVGVRMRGELLPYLLLSGHAARCYTKPRGYAGDYQAIAWFYEDNARGDGDLGRALDRAFLELPSSRAVKNRRELMTRQIRATLQEVAPRPAKVTSLACGPAQEVLDILAELPDPSHLQSTLVDFDEEALAHVGKSLTAMGKPDGARLLQENLISLATGRAETDLVDQDLVYSIGLIDYFDDALVVSLVNVVHRMLRLGGRILLGNFHPRNTTRALMDHVFDWRLIHRDEHDLDRLLQTSAFGRPATRMLSEPLGVNLFAECTKT